MKKIIVNKDACIGCGACVAIDPEHFNFNDEGLSQPISQTNLESENLENAIGSCPVAAISLSESDEEDTSESNCTCEDDDCCCCDDCHCKEE